MTDAEDIKALIARLQSPEHIREMRESSARNFARIEASLKDAIASSGPNVPTSAISVAMKILAHGQVVHEKIDQDLGDEIERLEAERRKPPKAT